MSFLRSTRVLLCTMTLLVPAAARTRPQARTASSVADLVQKIQEDKVALAYDEIVYSKSFDGMPGELKDYVCRRFREVLTGGQE